MSKIQWRRQSAIVLGLIVAGGLLWLAASRMLRGKVERSQKAAAVVESAPTVEVIHPQRGGIPRQTIQPGSLLAFESVDLYAMVSGYLKTQVVDIGSRIKKGEVLAEIDAPREAKAVDAAASLLEQAKAQTLQAVARVKSMEGERDAAAAVVEQAKSDIDRLVAAKDYAQKTFDRVQALLKDRAIDALNLDEHQRQLATAVAAERTANLAVLTAKAQLAAVQAKVEQARADVVEAKAAAEVAAAHLATANVNVAYTRIVAPFDGVVTMRAFNPGAFVRSATDGGQSPVLTVKRTDKMRVVVQVPDRDVVVTELRRPGSCECGCPGRPGVSVVRGPGRRIRRSHNTNDASRNRSSQPQGAAPRRNVRHGDHHPRTRLDQPYGPSRLHRGTHQ